MTKQNLFPLDDTTAAAHARGEAILALYKKAGCDADFDEAVTMAIADLAVLSDIVAGISHAEARAEGDGYAHSGMPARRACEDAADIAEEMLEAEREAARRDDGGLYDEVIG